MSISELIKILQKSKDKYGDVEVLIHSSCGSTDDIDNEEQ